MQKLRFDYRDVFAASRLGFSLQRMWIQLVGLIVGYGGYLVFTYLSYVLSGQGLAETWSKYGLIICPVMSAETLPLYSWLVFAVGVFFLLVAHLVTSTAVSRAAYMVMKGNNFYTWRESFAFSFRKILSIIATPVAIVALIGLFVLGSLVVGLMGKIPFVGEIGVSLFSVIWFVAAMLIVFFAVILGVTLVLTPAILATTDEDAFEAIFQTFSTVWSQPWRLVFYELINIALAVVAVGIFAIVVKQSLVLMNGLFSQFMGAKFINMANNGQYYVQSWTLLADDYISAIYSRFSTYMFFQNEFQIIPKLAMTVQISAVIYALSLLFIGGWVVSYGLSSLSVGHTIAYVVIRNKKDKENLLERTDKEEETEDDEEGESEKPEDDSSPVEEDNEEASENDS